MKKLYFFSMLMLLPFLSKAQCFAQVQCMPATCFGSCDGSAACFPSGGTGPYTYTWTPTGQTTQTITGLCAGTYMCTVVDAVGCVTTASCTVTEPSQLMVAATVTQQASCSTCCDGAGVGTATGGTPPYTAMWSGPSMINGFTATTLCVGTYTFCVIDANGCSSCTTVSVTFSTGIASTGIVKGFDANPNPATNDLTITAAFANGTAVTLSIVNMVGEVVYSKNEVVNGTLNEKVDISALPAGPYFVQLKTDLGSTYRKVIKQ